MTHKTLLSRLTRAAVLLTVLSLLALPALAQRPEANFFIIWTPETQLDSVDSGNNGTVEGDDDLRYAEMQMYVTSNIQYWAVDVSCNIGTDVAPIDPNSGNALTNDPETFMLWGPDWGTKNTDFITIGTYEPGRGNVDVTATRAGTATPPLGENGVETTDLLFSIQFLVRPADRDGRVSPRCNMDFLDRDGNRITRGRSLRTSDLNILNGYDLTGTAERQGSRDASNIQARCTHLATSTEYTVSTGRRGDFSFDERNLGQSLRQQGEYECTFSDPANEAFLDTVVSFNLVTSEYFLLPIMLYSGNYETNNSPTTIDIANDIAVVTSFWDQTVDTSFSNGDANGDRRVNESDLAIVAGNVGREDSDLFSHILYGIGRDYGGVFPNSKIWWGVPEGGAVTALDSRSRSRDFWPDASPSGTEYAFVSYDDRNENYVLNVGNLSNGRSSTISDRRSPWSFLAPSWSPGGNWIAAVCGNPVDPLGVASFEDNKGFLCLQQPDDRRADTFTLPRIDGQPIEMKIYPPTWISDTVIVFAGHDDGDGVCDNTLCAYDLGNNTLLDVSATVATNNDRADMPYYVEFDGTSYMAYRFYDSGGDQYFLRVATITYDDDTQTFGGGIVGPVGVSHIQLDTKTVGVDYYTVSPYLDILYYDEAALNLNIVPLDTANAIDSEDDWGNAIQYRVDGMVGNPPRNVFDASRIRFFAERMTFDWIP